MLLINGVSGYDLEPLLRGSYSCGTPVHRRERRARKEKRMDDKREHGAAQRDDSKGMRRRGWIKRTPRERRSPKRVRIYGWVWKNLIYRRSNNCLVAYRLRKELHAAACRSQKRLRGRAAARNNASCVSSPFYELSRPCSRKKLIAIKLAYKLG